MSVSLYSESSVVNQEGFVICIVIHGELHEEGV